MELCPLCKTQLYIKSSKMEVVGDKSPDTQTEVYTVLSQSCRNPVCDNYGKDVAEIRLKQYPKEE